MRRNIFVGFLIGMMIVTVLPTPTPVEAQVACAPGTRFNYLTGQPCAQQNPANTPGQTTACVNLTRTLSRNVRGEDVIKLQTFLKAQGDFTYPTYTQNYGPMTRAAVIKFQTRNGISPIGTVGPLTRAKISQLSCRGIVPPVATLLFTRTLTQGSVGVDVKLLQQTLNKNPRTRIALTGAGSPGFETMTFGPATRAAVIKFQQLNGITVSGTVSTATIAKLNQSLTANPSTSVTPPLTPAQGGGTVVIGGSGSSSGAGGGSGSAGGGGSVPVVDTTPPVISNVKIDNTTDTTIVISWKTDEDSDSVVRYQNESIISRFTASLWNLFAQATGSATREKADRASKVKDHAITVDGLSPDTLYSFQVSSTDSSGNSTLSTKINGRTKPQGNINYTITATAGVGGSISPLGVATVQSGSSQTYNISAATGYQISQVTVSGINQGALSTYTFSNVTSNQTISATFIPKTYTITASAGTGGAITPSGVQTVAGGGNMSFKIDPAAGYQIASVMIDNVAQTIAGTYAFTNISANHVITASFSPVPTYTVTATAGAGGTVSPANQTVNSGANATVNIVETSGYEISAITVDGVAQAITNPFYLSNVTSNKVAVVSFRQIAVTPTPTPTIFAIGARVQTTNTINVRSSPGISSTNLLGSNPMGTPGTIMGGSQTTSDGIIWWQINYDVGFDGWSGQDNLSVISGTPPPSTSTDGFQPTVTLPAPSQAAVNAAIAQTLIRFDRAIAGGAHTNGAWFGGASITLALASYSGNTSADARLLEQMRYSITGNNDITANGGYPAQHERNVTGMYTIAKYTPRIWNQLTDAEKIKIDLVMKAALVSSAFTTSDMNPFIAAGSQEYALDGDNNLSRTWNPNYREGMVGGVLNGLVYFGGPANADAILNTYNHTVFVGELLANGLTNLYETFNWKTANPSSPAPSGTQIQNAVRNYRYLGSSLSNYSTIYTSLVNDTYSQSVNCGLNGGAGIGGAGKIVSGCATLPNPGAIGMLKEYNSSDAGGARSATNYAYDGYRPHMTNNLLLLIGGYIQKGTVVVNSAVTRLNIGNTDLWYKIDKGYIGYYKGTAQETFDLSFSNSWGFAYNRSLWEDVLKQYYGTGQPPVGTFTVTATAGANGSVNPASQTVNSGSSATINITAASGYQIAAITVDGVNQAIANPFILSNVTSNKSINTTFSQIPVGGSTCSSVAQYGITWTFDRAYTCGSFANGDSWIVGPAVITSITPNFANGRNGWEVNPTGPDNQGFDSRMTSYVASRVPTLPYTAQPNQSIVKGISYTGADCYQAQSCLQTAAVLTVLGQIPPNNGSTILRPPYAGTSKPLFSTSNLRTDLLLSLAPPAGAPTLDSAYQLLKRVQLDHKSGWTGREMHPMQNMQNYGAGIAHDNGKAILRLSLNDPLSTKMPLLTATVQAGIDYHGMLKSGSNWAADGGHNSGRKIMILFAGLMLNDAEMLGVSQAFSPYNPSSEKFAEDTQTWYTTQNPPIISGTTNTGCYATLPTKYGPNYARYGKVSSSEAAGTGEVTSCSGQWSSYWELNSQSWVGQTLAARLYGLTEEWNNQAFFDHLDRRIETYGYEGTWGNAFNNNMWTLYRNTVSTPAPTTDTIAPSTPSNVSASVQSSSAINLTWTASTDNVGVTQYRVFRGATQIGTPAGTSYSDTGLAAGTQYLYQVAAVDNAGNVSAQSAAITATTQTSAALPPPPPPAGFTYSIWSSAATPAIITDTDATPVELGVKFASSVSGSITGIRFYKGPQNTGTHIGNLWTSTGTKLGTVTFTGETASGWQQANFSSPIAISANTTYIASYYAPVAKYSANSNYFGSTVTNGPLTALTNSTPGGNGVYLYANGGGFPNQTFGASNYWVDVVFVSQ